MKRQQLLVSAAGHVIGGIVGVAVVAVTKLWPPTSWGEWLVIGLIVLAGAEIGSLAAGRVIREKPESA